MPLVSGHRKYVEGILRLFYAPEEDRPVISSDGDGSFYNQDVHVLGVVILGVAVNASANLRLMMGASSFCFRVPYVENPRERASAIPARMNMGRLGISVVPNRVTPDRIQNRKKNTAEMFLVVLYFLASGDATVKALRSSSMRRSRIQGCKVRFFPAPVHSLPLSVSGPDSSEALCGSEPVGISAAFDNGAVESEPVNDRDVLPFGEHLEKQFCAAAVQRPSQASAAVQDQ